MNNTLHNLDKINIAVIGLGYVGLPLAVEFSKKRFVIGFDINHSRISELRNANDATLEVNKKELLDAKKLKFTSNKNDLKACNFFIITVPTPVNEHKQPDLECLIEATKTVAEILKPGDIVVYESTVYPGATEEVCVPILEAISSLKYICDENKEEFSSANGFYCGYSPERINPGDKMHKLTEIIKVISGSTSEAADLVHALYSEIIVAGIHRANSIRVAEAAKVIENTQRDLNIALINEFAIIFGRLGLDTESILEAAGTKWNFLPFRPGLVGGHCIGVDPYYLTHKAQSIGYYPEVILAGRRLNDGMGCYVANRLIKEMIKSGIAIDDSRILIMGFTFKENCPDIRNTRVIDIIDELKEFNCNVDVYDPWINLNEATQDYGINVKEKPIQGEYDAIVLAVKHREFEKMGIEKIRSFGKKLNIIYDLKYIFPIGETNIRL